jgi:hypothetical protein
MMRATTCGGAGTMNKHRLITMGILALVTAVAGFLLFSHNSARTALEETRRALRQQGFKIDLAEFDFSTSPELRARATALTNADLTGSAFPRANPARRLVLPQERLNFMPTVGSNAALVVWKQEKLPTYSGQDPWLEQTQSGKELWVTQREIFNEERASLDAACEAAMSGPIRFDLVASQGLAIVLRHLLLLKNLTQILDTRAVLELHDGNKDAAWTNLLASTRLVSAWNPEPVEVSHLVRFECATLAYNATWQALQADGWADDRLALLQQEWESVDFFHGLPETEAFTRAGAAALCELERQEPLPQRLLVGGILRSPRNAWYRLVEHWRRIRYRHHGSYEDESALLLHYRDRELQVRRAVQSSNWSEMRPLPVITNMMPFYSKDSFRMQTELNRRQMMLGIHIFNTGGGGQGLLGRAAEAEARRRLLMAAIALERYRIRHSGYPKTLQELVPELLQSPPVDFMDGKPLRYRLGEDGRFVLYSVGLDCVDDGGKLPRRERRDAYNP